MSTDVRPPGLSDALTPGPALRLGAVVGRFELLERIGDGRLGAVWRARDMGTGTHFALKFIADPPPDVATRLEAEVRAWRWVRQRNLVPITELLEDDGRVAVVCPLVEGTPLSDVLQDGAAMELSEAIPLFRALLDALTTAHAAGRVHGAMCPDNVLLEIDEVRINPRVTDAGLGIALGLPVETNPDRARYVAPEVGVDGEGSVPADIFALGVMLYEMVCGQPPFSDRAIPEGGRLEYPLLDRVVPDCPQMLARAVDRAMAVAPQERFESVVAFKAAIAPVDRWIGDEPTQPFTFDWTEAPHRSSIRTRTLGREGTDSGARPAPVAPVPELVPVPVVPVSRPSPAPSAPAAAPAPAPVVPVSRAPVVIQLAPENVNDANPELVRELDELNAAPTRSIRWVGFLFRWVLAPVATITLVGTVQCYFAGQALYEARTAMTRARNEVDADMAAAAGYVERLVALGASREALEPALLGAQREKDLLARSAAVDSYRDLLASVVRDLPPATKPEAILDQRTVQKGIDGLGGNGDAHRAAFTALTEAEDLPLVQFADEWGFATADPVAGVLEKLEGEAE